MQAVYAATNATGGTTVTVAGTLTQGANGFTYAAGPADRLVVRFTNGVVHQFAFTRLRGDFTQTSDNFFGADHDLAFRFQSSPSTADFTVTRTRGAGTVGGSLQGTDTYDGTTFSASVTNQGTVTTMVDQGYAENTRSESLQGSVSGGTLAITVNETRGSHLLYFNGTLTRNTQRTMNDAWTDGTSSLSMRNAQVRQAFINGAPGDFSYWVSQGALVRDGAVVGALGWTQGAATIDVWMDVDGQRVVLETYAAR